MIARKKVEPTRIPYPGIARSNLLAQTITAPVAMPTIGVYTSASPSNVEALIEKLRSLIGVDVDFVQLPYNDLGSYRLDQFRGKLDGIILCHSINNRRFAITNVLDALYDKFLPHATRVFGKENVCVIVHDFPWPMRPSTIYSSRPVDASKILENHDRIKATHMESFRIRQYTTFECCSLAMLCGRLDSQVDMDEANWTELREFLKKCSADVILLPDVDQNPKCQQSYKQLVYRMWADVKKEIFHRAIERSADFQGLIGCIWWLCLIPPKLMWYSMTFVLSLVCTKLGSYTACFTPCKEAIFDRAFERSADSQGLVEYICWIGMIPLKLMWYTIQFMLSLVF